MIQTPTDLAEFVSSAMSYLKLSLNVKIFVKMLKILALTANLSHIPRVQKPGLRPTALAFLYPRPGQRLGPAFFGLAWPGFWPQAGAGTSLGSHHGHSLEYSELKVPTRSEVSQDPLGVKL